MTIVRKLTIMSLGALLLLAILISGSVYYTLRSSQESSLQIQRQDLLDAAKQRLQEQIDIAQSMINHFGQLAEKDPVNIEEYKQQAVRAIKAIQWQNGGYFFIYQYSGDVVIVPPRPDLAGTNMLGSKDINGVYYVKELIQKAQAGGGFVEYVFSRPGVSGTYPKLGVSVGYSPWQWMIGTGVYIDDIDKKVALIQGQLDEQSSTILRSVFLLTLITLIILGILLTKFVGKLLAPLTYVSQLLNEISSGNGDLTVKIPIHGQDEVGRIGTAFNVFVQKIHQIISEVQNNTQSLASQSEELNSTAEVMSGSIKDLKSKSMDVRTSSKKSTDQMHSMAAASEEFSSTVTHVAATVEELTASFRSVVESCDHELTSASHAKQRVDDTVQAISEMEKASLQIGKVSELIQGIASQTNLLALNATIEAASAGEAGKGFAVVAGEVKDLARQTAQAVTTIAGQIESMQQQAKVSSGFVLEINSLVGEVEKLAKEVLKTVQEQSQAVSEFSHNLSGASSAAKEIAQGISAVSEQQNSIHTNIGQMDQLAESSNSGISQIRLSMDEMSKRPPDLILSWGSLRHRARQSRVPSIMHTCYIQQHDV